MSENADLYLPAEKCSWWSANRLVAAVVVVHLVVTCLAAALTSHVYRSASWPGVITQLTTLGLIGLHIGQIHLVASWLAFSDQAWFPRILRFASLAAWIFLLRSLGEYLVEGEIVKSITEEFAAHELLMIVPPLLLLLTWRLWSGRRFSRGETLRSHDYQFSTRQLLFVTAEAAALLAVGRVVLSWNMEHFWNGLTGVMLGDLFPRVASMTVLPVVFYGLARRRTWLRFRFLMLYLLLSSLLMACVWTTYEWVGFGSWPDEDWWLSLLLWLFFFWVQASAAFTILFTYYLLRRIGYDFRRRGEGPEGRSSSNARNSAASASA